MLAEVGGVLSAVHPKCKSKLALATCQSRARDPKPKQLWRGRLKSFAVLLNLNKGLELFLGHWILDL